MQQSKFSLTQPLMEFLGNYKLYGFKDKSDMVRVALARLKDDIERRSLKESADLYAEIYESDTELQELTESAITGWPE
jgi:hypothetical protein